MHEEIGSMRKDFNTRIDGLAKKVEDRVRKGIEKEIQKAVEKATEKTDLSYKRPSKTMKRV